MALQEDIILPYALKKILLTVNTNLTVKKALIKVLFKKKIDTRWPSKIFVNFS